MSSPTFENIDQWLFEFTEGNLSPAKESQLMDFLSMHPELMEELKLWQHAKISPTATPHVNIHSLTKASPLILRPLLLVSIGIIGVLIAWIALYNFPYQPQYTTANVDTRIISIGLEKKGFEKSSTLNSQSKESTEGIVDNNNSFNQATPKESPLSNRSSLYENQAFLRNSSRKNTSGKEANTMVNNINLREGISNSIEEADFYADLSSPNNLNQRADGLNDVIAYINRETTREAENDNEEIKSVSNVNIAKVTHKKTLSNITRKIKKMIDQPTALRNTRSPYYHAPMMTGFKANPGMVGSASGSRIQATSRLQWYQKENAQIMNSLSWDGYIYSLRGGLGVDVNYNTYKGNSLNNYSVGVVYSPKFSINNHISFEPALSFKLGVMDIDPKSEYIGRKIEMHRNNSLAFFEGEKEPTGSQLWYKDVGLGFMLNTKSFYIGFNADNLGRHNNNYHSNDIHKKYRENIYYTAVIGTEYQSLTKDISVNGYGLFQNYGNLNELWLGANFRYKWLHIGSGVNTKLDFGLSAGANINSVSLHYNIDYINSELMNRKALSHQLTLRILLKPSRYAVKFLNL